LSAPLNASELCAALSLGVVDVAGLTQEVALLCAALRATERGAALARSLVWISPTEEEAARAAVSLCALLGRGAARLIPDPPCPFLPSRAPAAVEGARLYALTRLARAEWELVGGAEGGGEVEGGGGRRVILCLSALAFAHRPPPPARLSERAFELCVGQERPRGARTQALERLGYARAERVEALGELRFYGDRLDLFPPHLPRPLRVSFWGDAIESIQPFHPQTQRATGASLARVTLTPARLLSQRLEDIREAGDGLRNLQDDLLDADRSDAPSADPDLAPLSAPDVLRWVSALNDGLPPAGVDALGARLLNEQSVSLHDLLTHAAPEGLCYVLEEPARALALTREREARWAEERAACLADGRLAAPLREHLTPPENIAALLGALGDRPSAGVPVLRVTRGDLRGATFRLSYPPHLTLRAALEVARGSAEPLAPLLEHLERWAQGGYAVVVACASEPQRQRLARLLEPLSPALSDAPPAALALAPSPAGVYLARGALSAGFLLSDLRVALLSGAEALGQPPSTVSYTALLEGAPEPEGLEEAREYTPFISAADELNEGDLVVHERYGVARYCGIEQLLDDFNPRKPFYVDCLSLEFRKNKNGSSKLLLPIYKLHELQRFVGKPNPRLASLTDTEAWEASKLKARKEAEAQADELLELYAERARLEGVAFSAPDERFMAFEAAFPHTETPDQERAIKKIISEMCAPKPMDHLLCGDVGFGKTEVAMRAAMKALLDGRQVAVLVPTTILAAQHTKTFRARFKDTPFRVEQLSRFVTPERAKVIRQELSEGAVHVIIGTQSLLSKSVHIPHLGLLVLDEEHRFGVKDKELLRSLRANLDVLSMTATPIPRTLHLSLSGIRSLSILSTPPRDRQSIYTQLSRLSKPLVREAILAELNRGGQVFYVHNRVESIATRREWLQAVVPEATIAVAHGDLKTEELEAVMHRFTEGAAQILLCTTIIETGIDIPRANTLIVEEAHRFGLSQLYQLRGRVGRSHERARCYLLLPPSLKLTPEATERLEALQRFTDLGSGFHVASRDLELRGAGQLLGTQQNGHSEVIGLELYHQLLREAIEDRQERLTAARAAPVISLPQQRLESLSPDYLPSPRERLSVHRRLAQCKSVAALDALYAELLDRFGEPSRPEDKGALRALFQRWRVSALALHLGLTELTADRYAVVLRAHAESPLTPAAAARAARALEGRLRSDQPSAEVSVWRYTLLPDEREDLLGASCALLTRLADQLI
jgi:transcription-repair coupling factor (superfamily II helicase)